MKKVLFLILFMQSLMSYAQEESDRVIIDRINCFVKNNITLNSSRYAIYFLRDKYLVITQSNDFLMVSYLSEKLGFEEYSKYEGDILQTLFSNEVLSSPFYVYMGDDFESSCVGSLMYLSIYDENQLASEFLLPSILLCDEKKVEYPISNVLLRELYNLVDSRWSTK